MEYDKLLIKELIKYLNNQEIDELYMRMDCQMNGIRNNKKGIQKLPRISKEQSIIRKSDSASTISEALVGMYQTVLEDEKIQKYKGMSTKEFIVARQEIKALEKKQEIALIANMLTSARVIKGERSAFIKACLEQNDEEETKKEEKPKSERLVFAYETQIKELHTEIKKHKDEIEGFKEKLKHLAKMPPQGEDSQTKKDLRELKKKCKITEDMLEECKKKEGTLLKQLEKEQKRNTLLSEKLKIFEGDYTKNSKQSESKLREQSAIIEALKTEKEELERYIANHQIDKRYLFIGSRFTKKKVERLKEARRGRNSINFVLTEQWLSEMKIGEGQISEVYILQYDIEAHIIEKLRTVYGDKLVVFKRDHVLEEYITQWWEA